MLIDWTSCGIKKIVFGGVTPLVYFSKQIEYESETQKSCQKVLLLYDVAPLQEVSVHLLILGERYAHRSNTFYTNVLLSAA